MAASTWPRSPWAPSDMHTVKAFLEAEAYDGPSLIIAYSHCIAHGYDLAHGMDQQKAAVNSGYWPLFRYNPDLVAQGKNPFQLDSRPPTIALKDYIYNETRYTMLAKSNPEHAKSSQTGPGRCRRQVEALRTHVAPERCGRRRGEEMIDLTKTIDLSTTYLGLKLKNPLVASSSPMCRGRRQRPPPGRCRRRRRRPAFALRGADRSSRATNSIASSTRGAERLRRSPPRHFPDLTPPRDGPGRLPDAHRQVQTGGPDSRHRQPQRHHHAAAGSSTPRRCSRPAPTRWS